MPRPSSFPVVDPNASSKAALDGLSRLVSTDLFRTQYIDAKAAAALIGTGLKSFAAAESSKRWAGPILSRIPVDKRLATTLSALFDYTCNAEYVHGRVSNRSWIYCTRPDRYSAPHAYYSFLKQCPECCQDRPLEKRLEGAQHKPSSHHIGEITTTIIALLLTAICESAPKSLELGVITKQSHDVDLVGWAADLLVLFEVKASPLVTYPLRVDLHGSLKEVEPDAEGDELREIGQHSLIDVDYKLYDISLYLSNRDLEIPLGKQQGTSWPYKPMCNFISSPDGFLDYLEAWVEIYLAYSIPKTRRAGRDVVLGYLANGWGDEIDSNKTKAGLGRTDDIKKGTYQLLKFGAYYRAGSPTLPIRGTLLTNLDPLFMHAAYLEKLLDGRWSSAKNFTPDPSNSSLQRIREEDLFYIYDAVLAFNMPTINDERLKSCFDLQATAAALKSGRLDAKLDNWIGFLK